MHGMQGASVNITRSARVGEEASPTRGSSGPLRRVRPRWPCRGTRPGWTSCRSGARTSTPLSMAAFESRGSRRRAWFAAIAVSVHAASAAAVVQKYGGLLVVGQVLGLCIVRRAAPPPPPLRANRPSDSVALRPPCRPCPCPRPRPGERTTRCVCCYVCTCAVSTCSLSAWTQIAGEAGAGKTQLCLQLLLQVGART